MNPTTTYRAVMKWDVEMANAQEFSIIADNFAKAATLANAMAIELGTEVVTMSNDSDFFYVASEAVL